MALRHARLIESPVGFAGGWVAGQTVPYAQMTSLAELQAARVSEESRRGSVGGWVAMTITGGLAAFVAAPVLFYVALLSGLSGTAGGLSVLFVAAIVTFCVGAVMFGVGLGLMIATITRNAKIGHNLRLIDRRMRELQKQQQYAPPPVYQQPYAPEPYMPQQPSAPPPPPQGFLNVEPTLELASF